MARLSAARGQLADAIATLPDAADAAGWRAQDHLAHVIAWEEALTAVLRGGTTPGALGFSTEEYAALDTDALNQQLVDRMRSMRPSEIIERLHDARRGLLTAVDAMTDDELAARFEEVRQAEAPDEPEWSAWDWLLAYAPEHDEEHAGYIRAL